MKLIVLAGRSFSADGQTYKPGEEIPEKVFSDKNALKSAIDNGGIIEVGLSAEKIEEIKTEAFAAGKKDAEKEIKDLKEEIEDLKKQLEVAKAGKGDNEEAVGKKGNKK